MAFPTSQRTWSRSPLAAALACGLLLGLTTFIAGCEDNTSATPTTNVPGAPVPGNPAAPTVEGQDFSGTYNLTGVGCLGPSGETRDIATLSRPTDQVTISGNTYTQNINGSGCNARIQGRIVFNTNGEFTLSNGSSIASPNPCQIEFAVASGAPGGITPATATFEFDTRVITEPVTAKFFRPDSNRMYIQDDTFTNGSGEACYLVYSKQ